MQVNTKGSLVLGDKLNDPYKLDNMNNAFLELAASGIQFPFSSVSPTGKYVRVLIHTDEELEQLESDTSIIWFEYPLDYAIAELGCSYYDPTLSDSTYSWQYGVVPIEYTFPENLYVEQIYSVFIPEDYPEYSSYSNILDLLEDVSDSKCNSENMQVAHSLTKSSKWNPSAQVEVWDDEEDGYVPLDGVRVIARKCTKSRYAITDELGQCTINTKFKGNVDYSIEWRRHYWRIVKGQYNKKTYLIGPTTNSSWNLSIAKSSESDYMRATIHRAAIVANYKDIWTIKRPRKSNFLGCIIKLKIRYENSNNGDVTGSTQNGSNNLNGADVVIWGKNQNNELYLTQDVFSSTIHELAHFSHRLFYNKNNPSGNFDQDVNQFKLKIEN